MVKFLKSIPAGTFLVPLLISAVLYTIWPNLFSVGGLTEQLLGGGSVTFIIAVMTFISGFSIDLDGLGPLIKRHGVIILVKLIICFGASFLYINLFGQSGIWGISAIAFTVGLCSMNPAVYIALVDDFGVDLDKAAFGLTALFSIPAFPMIIYALSGSGEIEWMPIITTLIPLLLGILLGNIDENFKEIFGSGITVLTPILGWNLGQGMNLLEALGSGVAGLILVVMFYVLMSPLFLVDLQVLKNDGIIGLAMTSAAGASTAFPLILARANPDLAIYVESAATQILTLAIATMILTPILTRFYRDRFLKE